MPAERRSIETVGRGALDEASSPGDRRDADGLWPGVWASLVVVGAER